MYAFVCVFYAIVMVAAGGLLGYAVGALLQHLFGGNI